MKLYKVMCFVERGGYTTVEANSKEEAEEKVQEMLDQDGEDAIQDQTHGSCETMSVEEVKE